MQVDTSGHTGVCVHRAPDRAKGQHCSPERYGGITPGATETPTPTAHTMHIRMTIS